MQPKSPKGQDSTRSPVMRGSVRTSSPSTVKSKTSISPRNTANKSGYGSRPRNISSSSPIGSSIPKDVPQAFSFNKVHMSPKLSSSELGNKSPSPVLSEEEEEDKDSNSYAAFNTGGNSSVLSPPPTALPTPRPLVATPLGAASTMNISRFAGTSLSNLENVDLVMKRMRDEAGALKEAEVEQQKLQGSLEQSRNMLLQKSQEEISILRLTMDEQKETYETKLREQSRLHEERLGQLVKEYELKLSMHGEADKARVDAKEGKIKSKYEAKLRDYEGMVSKAMESCRQREMTSSGVIMECRRELSQAKLAADAKEQTLRDELKLKDNRLSDIQQKLQTFHDVQRYGKIWKNNAINISYAYLQLCATSTIKTEVEKDNFTQYLSNFDRIFENMKVNEEENIRNEVCVNKKAMKKLLKQAKKILERAKCEEEILRHNKTTTLHSQSKDPQFNNSDVNNVCESTYGLLVSSDEDDLFYPY